MPRSRGRRVRALAGPRRNRGEEEAPFGRRALERGERPILALEHPFLIALERRYSE